MNKLSEKTEIYFLKEYSKGKAENIVSPVETYFVSGWITFDDAVIISHFAGYIMYSYVIAKSKKMREIVTATPRVKLRFSGRSLSLIPCWSKFSKVTSLFLFQI